MGKKLTREDLSLVSDFSQAAYRYKIRHSFEDRHDGAEIYNQKRRFIAAAGLAQIVDYKILSSLDDIVLYVRTEEEFERASIALRADTNFEEAFFTAPEGYDFRKLKNRCRRLQKFVDQTPLRWQVHLGLDRTERSIVVLADNKAAYLGFRALMTYESSALEAAPQ